MTEPIVIAGTHIRRDHEGRFCINDLHRASGGEKRHQPSNWLNLQQTKALIGAIERAAAREEGEGFIEPLVSRQGLGSFGVKSLVYAYAMWVSPEFNLRVIEAYDALQMQRLQGKNSAVAALPDFNDPVAAARAWADEAEKVQKLASLAQEQSEHLQAALPAMEFHAAVANSNDSVTIGQFAKLMGTGEMRFFELLRRERILIAGGARHNLPYQQHLDTGRFRVNESTYTDLNGRVHLRFQTRITPKGQLWLQRRFFPRMTNAMSETPDMFAPQVEQTIQDIMPSTNPLVPYSETAEQSSLASGTATVDNIEKEISRLREIRRDLASRKDSVLQSPSPLARAESPEQVRDAGQYGIRRPMQLRDDFGDLSHPSQEREASAQRYRN